MRKADYFEKFGNDKVRCTLCPHYCILSVNQTGLCLGRKNIAGELTATNYEKVLTIADDPIEKKPLYHFHPGTMIISAAQSGCNLKCPFCQNYDISQNSHESASLPIEGLYSILKSKNRNSIAFTYTEPLMWYEYIYDFGSMFGDEIEIILVTNGTINEEPLKKIIPYIRAANIDLKSFNKDFYRDELNGDLETVKRSIQLFYENNVHIEITHLLIPQKTDNINEFRRMIDFIYSLSPEIPFHISRYFPNYKYALSPTKIDILKEFYSEAKKLLKYVYLGNVIEKEYSNTYCPKCGSLLIERDHYDTVLHIKDNLCFKCREKINVIL
jgi:pyruvate formate lyase activating enzyme